MGDDLTRPERIMRNIIEDIGVSNYQREYKIGNRPTEIGKKKHNPYRGDFYIPPDAPRNHSRWEIVIEVEGEYPHPDAKDGTIPPTEELTKLQEYNAKKDLRKENRYEREGYTLARVPETALYENPDEVKRRVERVLEEDKTVVESNWLIRPTEKYAEEKE